jgi:asparagine synthase (glutamine-hydrolysing)
MCGITGVFAKNATISRERVEKMTSAIAHRGPDAQGVFSSPNNQFHLGHRRLSIIDLSTEADQPMVSRCGDYVIVFNGEIYNFQLLREELTKEFDVVFSTQSDTEVLLQAFIHWGKQCVDKLNGMFAFAIVDLKDQSLWLFRDRIGIKPLYYFWDGSLFAFGSELKTLTPLQQEVGEFQKSREALIHYFRLGYIPAPFSIYEEVKKFPVGHYACVNDQGLALTPYWELNKQINPAVVFEPKKAKEQLHGLVQSSVDYRLKSDVPFGAFLSGGIDSSLVAAVAQDRSAQNLNTFSIGFKESNYNESEYASRVAQHIGSNHHSFEVSYKEAMDLIPQLKNMYDEPFADSSAIPTFLVSKLAKTKVKMALSGDGGDEQFMGYGMYNWAKRLDNPFLKPFGSAIHLALKKSKNNRYQRASELFNTTKHTNLPAHIFSVEQYFFSHIELNELLKTPQSADLPPFLTDTNRKLSSKEQQALFDLNYYLPDDLLVKVDRASMQNGLEVRVPLLDHRIVEFSLNLHEHLKAKGDNSKFLLKEVLYDYVPKEFFNRPKWGFSIPLEQWLQQELRYLIEDYLSPKAITEAAIFNVSQVEQLKKRFFAGETYLYNKLWLLICYQMWSKE